MDTGKIFDDCTGLIQNTDLKTRMAGIRQDILDRSTDYDARADAGEMHIIARHEPGLGDVAAEDLIKNYTLRMSRKNVPARPVYDALKILPRNNRCPFCNYGSVETLDHFLPKKIYPGFSVKPTNLVGSCDRCNRLKLSAAPTGPDDGFMHPYFDCINHTVWLQAEIVPSTPAAATFHVGSPSELDANLVSRIRTQFHTLELARLYSDAAADEIVDIEHALKEILSADGADAVGRIFATSADLGVTQTSILGGRPSMPRSRTQTGFAAEAFTPVPISDKRILGSTIHCAVLRLLHCPRGNISYGRPLHSESRLDCRQSKFHPDRSPHNKYCPPLLYIILLQTLRAVWQTLELRNRLMLPHEFYVFDETFSCRRLNHFCASGEGTETLMAASFFKPSVRFLPAPPGDASPNFCSP